MANPMPWEKWHYKDWLISREIGRASAECRGVWFEALNVMMESGTSELTDTLDGFARLFRMTVGEVERGVDEIERVGVADVLRSCNGFVTLTSRKRVKILESREQAREKMRKWREEQGCNNSVTVLLRDCNSNVTSDSDSDSDSDSSSDSLSLSSKGDCQGGDRSDPKQAPEVEAVLSLWAELFGPDPTRTDARIWIARRLGLARQSKGHEVTPYQLADLERAVRNYRMYLTAQGHDKAYAVRNFFNSQHAYCDAFTAADWQPPRQSGGGIKGAAPRIERNLKDDDLNF